MIEKGMDSIHHLNYARDQNQGKKEYQELQSKFDHLGIPCINDTIELSVLGHYLQASLSSFVNCANFIQDKIKISKSTCRRVFDLNFYFFIKKNFYGKRLPQMV